MFLVLFLPVVCAQLSVHLQLLDSKNMTQQRLSEILQSADLAFAGEPFTQILRYEDQVVNVRALGCAVGYYLSADKCVQCTCVNTFRDATEVWFEPISQ